MRGPRGSSFRAFLHPQRDIVAVLRGAGLEPRVVRRTPVWELAVVQRTTTGVVTS